MKVRAGGGGERKCVRGEGGARKERTDGKYGCSTEAPAASCCMRSIVATDVSELRETLPHTATAKQMQRHCKATLQTGHSQQDRLQSYSTSSCGDADWQWLWVVVYLLGSAAIGEIPISMR